MIAKIIIFLRTIKRFCAKIIMKKSLLFKHSEIFLYSLAIIAITIAVRSGCGMAVFNKH